MGIRLLEGFEKGRAVLASGQREEIRLSADKLPPSFDELEEIEVAVTDAAWGVLGTVGEPRRETLTLKRSDEEDGGRGWATSVFRVEPMRSHRREIRFALLDRSGEPSDIEAVVHLVSKRSYVVSLFAWLAVLAFGAVCVAMVWPYIEGMEQLTGVIAIVGAVLAVPLGVSAISKVRDLVAASKGLPLFGALHRFEKAVPLAVVVLGCLVLVQHLWFVELRNETGLSEIEVDLDDGSRLTVGDEPVVLFRRQPVCPPEPGAAAGDESEIRHYRLAAPGSACAPRTGDDIEIERLTGLIPRVGIFCGAERWKAIEGLGVDTLIANQEGSCAPVEATERVVEGSKFAKLLDLNWQGAGDAAEVTLRSTWSKDGMWDPRQAAVHNLLLSVERGQGAGYEDFGAYELTTEELETNRGIVRTALTSKSDDLVTGPTPAPWPRKPGARVYQLEIRPAGSEGSPGQLACDCGKKGTDRLVVRLLSARGLERGGVVKLVLDVEEPTRRSSWTSAGDRNWVQPVWACGCDGVGWTKGELVLRESLAPGNSHGVHLPDGIAGGCKLEIRVEGRAGEEHPLVGTVTCPSGLELDQGESLWLRPILVKEKGGDAWPVQALELQANDGWNTTWRSESGSSDKAWVCLKETEGRSGVSGSATVGNRARAAELDSQSGVLGIATDPATICKFDQQAFLADHTRPLDDNCRTSEAIRATSAEADLVSQARPECDIVFFCP